MDTHPHTSAQMPISDGHPSANGGTPQGPGPPPAAGLPLGGRACTDARKRKRPPPPGGGRGSDHPCSHRAWLSSQAAAPPRKAVPPREPTWRSPPPPPPASASLRHATACFATPPFLLGHLTSAFFSPVTDGGAPRGRWIPKEGRPDARRRLRPRRVLLCGTLPLASPYRRFICVI